MFSPRNRISQLPLIDEGGGGNCVTADFELLLLVSFSLAERLIVQVALVCTEEMANTKIRDDLKAFKVVSKAAAPIKITLFERSRLFLPPSIATFFYSEIYIVL